MDKKYSDIEQKFLNDDGLLTKEMFENLKDTYEIIPRHDKARSETYLYFKDITPRKQHMEFYINQLDEDLKELYFRTDFTTENHELEW